MNTKFKRPKFTTEFKQGAVKLVTEQGYTRQAADSFIDISYLLVCVQILIS